jgi:predicted exporter
VTARGRAAVLIWIVFLAACAIVASRAHFTTDLSAFLPGSPTPSQRVLVDQLREGVVSQLLLVAMEGAPQARLAQISTALTEQLAAAPEFIYVSNGAQERMQADAEFLLTHRYLLSPGVTAERFSVAGLRAALEEDLKLLTSPAGTLLGRVLPRDPTGELLRLLDLWQPGGGPQKREGVWFSAGGERALLIARTRAAGFDIDGQERALQRLRERFARTSEAQGAPAARLLVSGPGVFAVASRAAIKRDVTRISWLAVVLVSALLLAVYRSPRLLLLILLPVVTGATAGVAAVSLAFGSVHGITLGFGATLLGEGVDYAIYLFSGGVAGPGPGPAATPLWRTLRLGVVTSVCGFGVLLLSDFPGLAQLGLFSITGLLVAFAVTRMVLPQLSPAGYRPQPLARLGRVLLALAQALTRLRIPLLIVVVLAAGWLAVRGASLWDDRLEALSPVPEAAKQLDEQLRRDLGAPDAGHLVVLVAAQEQDALETAERVGALLGKLRDAGALEGFESPALILPSAKTQAQRQSALPDPATLAQRIAEAARGLPFRAGLFEPFVQDVASARQGALLGPADLAGTGLRLRLDALLSRRQDGWVAVLPLRGVTDASAVAAALREPGLASVHLLDLKQETQALYRSYRDQVLHFALIGAGAIVLILLSSLRSLRRAGDVLAPLVAALVVATAVLTLSGDRLTLFHLVGMLLVVGVGSNYTLFFESQNFVAGDPERTVASTALCNASTVIGFGLLGLAMAPVLSAIGKTVAIGALLSLVFAAILTGPSRRSRPG